MIDFEFCGREVVPMSVSYNKLWKLLIDKKMTASDLRKAANVAPNTMTKLRRDEDVSLDVLGRICAVLNVNIGDIMDFIFDDQKEC
jgi:putative transcriptional regulator